MYTGMTTAPDTFAVVLDHQRSGRLEEAKAACDRILEDEPDHPRAWHLLAAIHRDLEQPADQERCLRQVLERAPEDAAAHHDLALALAEQDRLDEAETACR